MGRRGSPAMAGAASLAIAAVWAPLLVVAVALGGAARADEAAPAQGGAPAVPAEADHVLLSFRRLALSSDFVAEGAALGDLDGDGHADVIAGPWWYPGPSFEARRPLVRGPRTFPIERYSDSFFAWVEDVDRDGRPDVVVVGFPGQEAAWLENPGPEGWSAPWPRHLALAEVSNESPAFTDLTGDGRPEVVCQHGGRFGWAAPDPADPRAPWTFHPLSPPGSAGGAFTHGLGVGDLNGDGRADLVEKSGWWEQPPSLDGDPAWTRHPFAFAERGGAQMLIDDVDGDGLADVITSLDAHGYGLAWFEQTRGPDGAIAFRAHRIMGATPAESRHGVAVGQLHALALADVDGDGLRDVITGKRYWAHGGRDPGERDPAVLDWLRLERRASGVVFVPQRIDDASGVGTQVTAGDANGDGLVDVVVSNKRGTFVHLQERRRAAYEEWAAAQPKERLPPSSGLAPAAAAAQMTAPPGFEVDLIAGEPDLHQPIALAIDDRGRLWVAEAHTYPVRAKEGEGRDQILIFEDADGDGRFETRKVFMGGLNLVSGLEVGFGGVWIGAAPYLYFVPDADGDDRPDGEPVVLLDGWGWQDTHETLNAFIWGPDGWLYGCHGVFTHSRVGKPGTPDDERVPLDAGFWRYHPVRHVFEVFAWGTSNPWGLDFDDHGQAFATACVIPHLFHVAQGGRYLRQAGPHFDRYLYDDLDPIADHAHFAGHSHGGTGTAGTDAAGGGHAHCGLTIYLGDAFPPAFRGALLFHNIHGNRINHDRTERRGSGFVARHAPDFVRANDRWFRGVALRYGPDGALYFIDWSDAQACHHTDARRWDRTNGRLFRLRYRGGAAGPAGLAARAADADRGAPAPLALARESDARLVERLLARNDWYARAARRILQERAAAGTLAEETQTALYALAERHPDETRRLRGLWALHGVGGLTDARALRLLASEHEHVRAWVVQLACERGAPGAPLLARFARLAARDPSPVVRLYLASALQRLPLDARWPIARALAARGEDASDPNLPLMLWYGVEPLVAAAPARALDLAWACAIEQVRRSIARRAAVAGPEGLEAVARALAAAPDPARQALLLDEMALALAGRTSVPAPPSWGEAVDRISAASERAPPPAPAGPTDPAGPARPTDPATAAALRERLERLAVLFGDPRSFALLRAVLADPAASPGRRLRAFGILTAARDPALAPALIALLDDPRLRRAAAAALAAYDDPGAPAALLERYEGFDAATRRAAIDTLAARPASARALLDAVAAGVVPRRDVDASTVRLLTRLGDDDVTAALERAWGAVRAPDEDAAGEIARLTAKWSQADAFAGADLARGRALAAASCLVCHRLFGEGADIGPDLTGSNRGDLAYLIEAIVAPSAVVGRAYEVRWAKLADGRVVSGFVVAEDDDAITLQGPLERVRVARAEIAALERSELSLMPEGLLDPLGDDEQRDLLAYLRSPWQVARPRAGPRVDPRSGREPGALEGEALAVISMTAGEARPQAMGGFPADRWSGAAQLWWTGARPGDRLALALPVERAGRYEVEVALTKARDYGVVQLSIDGAPAGPALDLFHPDAVVTTGALALGTFELAAGRRELAIEIVGAHPRAIPSYMAGLDSVLLRPAASGGASGAPAASGSE